MFDVGWTELLVIAMVLVIVVGPKDLPRMLRTFGRVTGQMRRMAGEFRRQFDDALRDAELDEVRSTMKDVRNLNPASDIRKALNPIRAVGDEIRSSLSAATKAPEPKVPSASEGIKPVEPGVADPGATAQAAADQDAGSSVVAAPSAVEAPSQKPTEAPVGKAG
ncbi:Sec-independent protein translocase protein TatB [Consotaella salsifontis]|uniref:Sec-independent protein translocase protein TatB n=1 Tax=Consotaella salsifontis TaxID=1365950 RepID=A0A1T4R5C3_9HYPH|nr:Sec-independent protein translocase protein TatB [Consotaella salsifontis]SKA10861.1 sec-independent protein translocase protein TatB [Consotaella salsifontis]